MTVAAVLVAYAACLGMLGSKVIGRARWTAQAPLLAIVTYLAASWSIIAALGLAGLTLAVHATALGGGLSHLIGACVLRLRATYSTPGGATVAGLGLTLAGAVVARTALTATTYLRVTGRQALRHAQTARLVGQPAPALGAVLVEHSQPAAQCVAGRHPTVILTTGAVQALDPGQLDAVLAHERAHLTGRHHRLLAVARIGRQVLPFLPLMRDTEEQIARLVELHADDAATRAHDPRLLATALVLLATADRPASALAAGATDSVQRIHRLLGPCEPLGRPAAAAARHRRGAGPDPGAAGLDPSRGRARPGKASGCLAFAVCWREQSRRWPVLPGMRIHRRNSLPEPPAGRAGPHDGRPGPRPPLAARYRRDRGNVRQAPESAAGDNGAARVQAASGETVAAAMQLAIALLTASLDSPELEAWTADALTPADADGLVTSWPACTSSPCCC